jgi:hypothetical protein
MADLTKQKKVVMPFFDVRPAPSADRKDVFDETVTSLLFI